jgi:ATP-grasp N-terminal domain
MPGRVLILAATTAYQVDDLTAAAERLGLEPVLGTDRCHVLAEVWPAGALALDFRDPRRAAEQVLDAAAAHPIDGVVATDEKTALIAAMVANRLRLPHGSVEAAGAAANKARFRAAVRAAGLP